MEQKQLEEERERHKANLTAYQQLISDNPKITVKTQWRKLKEELKDDPRFRAVDRLTRLTVFETRIKELERKELEQKRVERENKRRQERKNRDAFRALLQVGYTHGVFNVRTKWKEFRNHIKDTDLYNSMLGQSGYLQSTPHELYGDFIEDLQERYIRDEALLQNIVKEYGVVVTSQSAEEGFTALVATHSEAASLDPANVKLFFGDLKEAATKAEEREKTKLVKNFTLMLKGFKDSINENSVWGDEVRSLLLQEPSFIALDDEQERERVFTEFVKDLARTAKKPPQHEDSSSEEEGRIRSSSDEAEKKTDKKAHRREKKKRKHGHHRRHESGEGHEKRHGKHRKSRKKGRHGTEGKEEGARKHKRRHVESEDDVAETKEGDAKKQKIAQTDCVEGVHLPAHQLSDQPQRTT